MIARVHGNLVAAVVSVVRAVVRADRVVVVIVVFAVRGDLTSGNDLVTEVAVVTRHEVIHAAKAAQTAKISQPAETT